MDTKLATTNLTSIELDIAGEIDGSLANMLVEVTRDWESLTYRIVREQGPSGWPVVRFVAPMVDLFEFVTDYCGGDSRQASELLEIN